MSILGGWRKLRCSRRKEPGFLLSGTNFLLEVTMSHPLALLVMEPNGRDQPHSDKEGPSAMFPGGEPDLPLAPLLFVRLLSLVGNGEHVAVQT